MMTETNIIKFPSSSAACRKYPHPDAVEYFEIFELKTDTGDWMFILDAIAFDGSRFTEAFCKFESDIRLLEAERVEQGFDVRWSVKPEVPA